MDGQNPFARNQTRVEAITFVSIVTGKSHYLQGF